MISASEVKLVKVRDAKVSDDHKGLFLNYIGTFEYEVDGKKKNFNLKIQDDLHPSFFRVACRGDKCRITYSDKVEQIYCESCNGEPAYRLEDDVKTVNCRGDKCRRSGWENPYWDGYAHCESCNGDLEEDKLFLQDWIKKVEERVETLENIDVYNSLVVNEKGEGINEKEFVTDTLEKMGIKDL
jgi:hypothetical protein